MTDQAGVSLGPIMTLGEAAARLNVTTRALMAGARKAERGSKFGRSLRFTEDDLAAIMTALRIGPTEQLHTFAASLQGLAFQAEQDAGARATLKKREAAKAERKAQSARRQAEQRELRDRLAREKGD